MHVKTYEWASIVLLESGNGGWWPQTMIVSKHFHPWDPLSVSLFHGESSNLSVVYIILATL